MGEQVLKTSDLRLLLLADNDRLVPASPELVSPPHQPASLASQVGVHETHEAGQALGVWHDQQEMEVIGKKDEPADLDGKERLGSR